LEIAWAGLTRLEGSNPSLSVSGGRLSGMQRQADHLPERRAEVEALYEKLKAWAVDQPAIRAIGIAGSWARGDAKEGSDLDVLLLTTSPDLYTESDRWLEGLLPLPVVRREQFGLIAERRILLASGLQVELGIGPLAWASTTPIDDGTRRVVCDGLLILHDPDALLARLQRAVAP
jgi:predicted nucleotidyltransferase